MDLGMGLFLGLLIGVMLIVALFWGMHLGLEMAVDHTGKRGHFTAYGKCYAAIEIPWRGHVPPREMPPPRRP